LNLIVENATVGDYDDRVEDLLVIALHANQLVREPCNGIGFAAARRELRNVDRMRAVKPLRVARDVSCAAKRSSLGRRHNPA
jgi:hypothetical protein